MIKSLLLVVCLQTSLLSVIECCGEKRGSSRLGLTETDSYIEICSQEPLELAIVLDASTSVSNKSFETGKSFLEDYISQFEVGTGEEGVRVSVISFGRGVYPQAGFNLATYHTKEQVLAAICSIRHSKGDMTETDKGINYMHRVQMARGVVRPGARKIGVVITDGNSANTTRTKEAAEAARQDGITMFAVGVGDVRESELLNIAGDMSRVVAVKNYDQLASIKDVLSSKTCTKIMKPTTPPPPKIEKCGKLTPADVYFVFSPADLGRQHTATATAFIGQVIKHEDLDRGFRFGVVSGWCPDDQGFNLVTYSTVDGYHTRLGLYDLNPLPQLVERLLVDAYSVQNGGRADVSRVAVIFTSGEESEVDELALQVERLEQSGITVYISDASGRGVSVDGAVTLTGGSSTVQAETLITLLCPNLSAK